MIFFFFLPKSLGKWQASICFPWPMGIIFWSTFYEQAALWPSRLYTGFLLPPFSVIWRPHNCTSWGHYWPNSSLTCTLNTRMSPASALPHTPTTKAFISLSFPYIWDDLFFFFKFGNAILPKVHYIFLLSSISMYLKLKGSDHFYYLSLSYYWESFEVIKVTFYFKILQF